MSRMQESDYIPSNYPQGAYVDWGAVARSMSPIRAARYGMQIFKKWWHENDPIISEEKPVQVIRRAGSVAIRGGVYEVYEATLPDAPTPQDRLTHEGWKQAFAHHP